MLNRRQSKPPAGKPRFSARAAYRLPASPPQQKKAQQNTQPRPTALKKRTSLWYALYFPDLPDTLNTEIPVISVVAQQCQQISDCISLDGDNALVLEVGRSLRYFGGLGPIRQRIESGVVAQLSHTNFVQAVAPNASASLLLARTGQESVIGKPEDLRSRLGSIPTNALAIDLRVRKKLAKCGLFYLRDIWRLPSPELRIRFGRSFSDHIEHCLGLRPEVRQRWQAEPDYDDSYDADHGLYSTQQIVTACEQLLHRLENFLRKNHLCTDQLMFLLDYGNSNHATGGDSHHESITVNVRKAERSAQLFLLLLETQLSGMNFASEIYTITLRVEHFTLFNPEGGVQQKNRTHGTGRSSPLLDTLAARLGSDAVQRLVWQPDYCPEASTRMVSYLTPLTEENTYTGSSAITSNHNPCWLLQPPRALAIRNQQLHYLSPLTLLRGPRRIETRWWQEKGIRRDYYVAANAQGNLLWIYQDLARKVETQPCPTAWYLHGFFG
jgi:protein ImuB